MKTRLIRWLPMVMCMGLIFGLSADSNPYRFLPKPIESLGIIGHILEYGLLGVTTAYGVTWKQKINLKGAAISLAVCGLFALSDEFHQVFVPGRKFEVSDLLLDGTGMALGLIIYKVARQALDGRRGRNALSSGTSE
jgi:VanZ family protein